MSGERRPRIAFCGVGRMGAEMVAALTERGFGVTVWNRTAERATTVGERTGALVAETPALASRDADVVITMLTDGPAVLRTLDGEDGILAGAPKGAVVVDCSTTGADAARQAADRCAAAGAGFLDCPVSGSTVVARQGRLGLMVGGDAAVIARARPVLEALGTVVHVGPTGAGAAAKVAVNALLHTFSTALSECLVMARAAGVSSEALFEVLAAGVLWNRFLDYKRPAFTDPDNAPVAFDLRTATKDLRLAEEAGKQAGMTQSVVQRALELHQHALHDGFGDRDMAAMAAWFADTVRRADDPSAAGDPAPRREPERN
ncbi:MAG TPA: NAD(P)-dependent oxidoreductase [Intrasporangium sp.]|uniref:NAD(P)-dependent oxidoreductase n=1 Tax=Intrasporangium sp. TaxID=1925024 RepID=UPI002D77FFB7|nr:NAD(P)-dependent oxidoreductase [Intrasporangium sp.]HET7399086.1 NAD(P)-dependent oxidoreductase [Intrasporangium sp.]